MALRTKYRLPTRVYTAARPSLTPWIGLGIVLAVVLAIALCFETGIKLGNYFSRPSARLHPESASLRLDPLYTKGYLDGVKAGRRAGEMAPGRLTQTEMAQAIYGSEASSHADEKSWGPSYSLAFKRGALAGMKQRLRERYGPAARNSPPPRVIVVLPSPSPSPTPMAEASATPQDEDEPDDAPQPEKTHGIKRVVHEDGTVEYSNF